MCFRGLRFPACSLLAQVAVVLLWLKRRVVLSLRPAGAAAGVAGRRARAVAAAAAAAARTQRPVGCVSPSLTGRFGSMACSASLCVAELRALFTAFAVWCHWSNALPHPAVFPALIAFPCACTCFRMRTGAALMSLLNLSPRELSLQYGLHGAPERRLLRRVLRAVARAAADAEKRVGWRLACVLVLWLRLLALVGGIWVTVAPCEVCVSSESRSARCC